MHVGLRAKRKEIMDNAVMDNATDEFFTPERIAELLATPPDL